MKVSTILKKCLIGSLAVSSVACRSACSGLRTGVEVPFGAQSTDSEGKAVVSGVISKRSHSTPSKLPVPT